MRAVIALLLLVLSGVTVAAAEKAAGDAIVEKYERCGREPDVELRIAICTELIETDPNGLNRATGAAANGRGLAYLKKGDYDRAIADFDFVIKVDPTAATFYSRGEAYELKGDHDRAVADFNRAIMGYDENIKRDPRSAYSFRDRCFARVVVGQLSEALADCNEALRLRPKDVSAIRNRGFLYLRLKQFDLAMADYDALLQVHPTLATALFGRGLAVQGLGRANDGEADMAAATRLDPGIARWYERFGVRAQ